MKYIAGIIILLAIFLSWAISLLTATGFGIEYYHTWFEIIFLIGVLGFVTSERVSLAIAAVLLVVVSFVNVASEPMLRASDYVNSVRVVDSNISSLKSKEEDVRKVTLDMAEMLANKIIGQKVDGIQLSSQYQLNTSVASVQSVKGKLVWVLPLDYNGFAKWLHQTHIPGYVVISATDPKAEPKLVLGQKMTVSQNGFFSDDVARVAWFRSGMKSTDEHFEIDDNGKGYWICPVIKPSIGFNLDTVVSVLVINAETKESTELSIQDTMKKYPWIDRIWPEEIVEERVGYFGSLQNGWWNTMFGETNVNKPTAYDNQELWIVNTNGKLQWFTGMTSVNSDKSLVSAILVEANGGTDKPILREIPLPGVTDENGAVEAIDSGLGADGVKWHAVLPQPVIENNKFYWHTSIVSATNVFQKAGIVQGDDISNVFYGANISEAFGKVTKPMDVKQTTSTDSKEAVIAKMIQKIDELDALKKQLQSFK